MSDSGRAAGGRTAPTVWQVLFGLVVLGLAIVDMVGVTSIDIEPVHLGMLALGGVLVFYRVKKVKVGDNEIELEDVRTAAKTVMGEASFGRRIRDRAIISGGTLASPIAFGRASQSLELIEGEIDAEVELLSVANELEERVRRVARGRGVPEGGRPIEAVLVDAAFSGAIPSERAGGVLAFLRMRNRALHGARIDPEVADFLRAEGPAMLESIATLDSSGPSAIGVEQPPDDGTRDP